MAKTKGAKPAPQKQAEKKSFKKEILKSLDAFVDKSLEELMNETDQQAWERGESIKNELWAPDQDNE